MNYMLESSSDKRKFRLLKLSTVPKRTERVARKSSVEFVMPPQIQNYSAQPLMTVYLGNSLGKSTDFFSERAKESVEEIQGVVKSLDLKVAFVADIEFKRGLEYNKLLLKTIVGISNDLTAAGYDALIFVESEELQKGLQGAGINYSKTIIIGEGELVLYTIRLNRVDYKNIKEGSQQRYLEDTYQYNPDYILDARPIVVNEN